MCKQLVGSVLTKMYTSLKKEYLEKGTKLLSKLRVCEQELCILISSPWLVLFFFGKLCKTRRSVEHRHALTALG